MGGKGSGRKKGFICSKETCAKMSAAMKGKSGPNKGKIFSEESRAKMRAAKLGKPGPWAGIERGPQSAEWRRNIGLGNKGKPAYYPRQRFYYSGVPFRSSWEVAAAKSFDARGIFWEYETKQFEINETITYRPDFYLPELDCYWEVKGYFGPQSKETIGLFREKYPEISFIVATEPVLKLMGAKI